MQVFLEGYDAGKYYITLVISLIVTVACGIRECPCAMSCCKYSHEATVRWSSSGIY